MQAARALPHLRGKLPQLRGGLQPGVEARYCRVDAGQVAFVLALAERSAREPVVTDKEAIRRGVAK
jgi:hypothetical protein